MEVHRTPDERFDGLPGYAFTPHHVDVDGLRMHHLDEGDRSAPPVLLVHGEPTWSFLYRSMIPPLVAAGYRVIAPDHLGFGRSDKPASLEWYSYDRHTAALRILVETLDLRDVTVVVQDWGGPIGLRVATEDEDRFAALVLLNTGLMTGRARMSDAWWAFRDFVDRVKPDVPVAMLVERACARPVAPEVLRGYEAPFPEPEAKWGAAAFPLLVPTSSESPGAAEMIATDARLRRWSKPALVCFSDSDPIFPVAVGERLAERIPGARRPITVVHGAGHFLQEDAGEEIAAAIVAFLQR